MSLSLCPNQTSSLSLVLLAYLLYLPINKRPTMHKQAWFGHKLCINVLTNLSSLYVIAYL